MFVNCREKCFRPKSAMDIEVKISSDSGENVSSLRKPAAPSGCPQTVESTIDSLECIRKHVDTYLTKIIDAGNCCRHGLSPLECSYSASHWTARPLHPEQVLHEFSCWLEEPLPSGLNVNHGKIVYGKRSSLQHVEYWYPTNSSAQPIICMLAFVHGGYWQEVAHSFNGNTIASFLSQSIAFSMLHYPAVADFSLSEQIEGVAAAVKVLDQLCQRLDISTLVLMGHSAGAQLICMSFEKYQPSRLRSVILLSGVYFLRPLVDTYIGRPIRLTNEVADQCSPILRQEVLTVLRRIPFIILAVGGQESDAFQKNTISMADLLRDGRRQQQPEVFCLTTRQFDHFSLVQSLEHCDSPLRLMLSGILTRLLDRDV
ncbi:esterase [Trichuris trichiura]|uniref:Esterase n=1 Tax=Trichuris trichiura TaxID=36087 RepID=A0A077ZCR2_TRITR|nr:esterase [Trichuris trichiura]